MGEGEQNGWSANSGQERGDGDDGGSSHKREKHLEGPFIFESGGGRESKVARSGP